jgi:sugar phosphate isomerase/epimerase
MSRNLRISLPALMVTLAALFGATDRSLAGPTENRGGSDYHWYLVGGPGQEALFISHRVVLDYTTHKSEIDQQLTTMYANGQRRLRLSFEFADDDTPLRLHLANGKLSADDTARISALLATIKGIGFEEVYVITAGASNNNVHGWKDFNETAYQENFSVITQVREIMKASGIPYLLDLGGEYTPVSKGQEIRVQYCKRLWEEYVKTFGTTQDTVGFSIIATVKNDRYGHLRDIYGSHPPKAFDLHVYDHEDNETAYQRFVHAHQRVAEAGYGNVPFIIGESYYNDGEEADELAKAIKDTGHRVLFLLQFPHVRPPIPKPPHYSDVSLVPLEFDQYMKRGF